MLFKPFSRIFHWYERWKLSRWEETGQCPVETQDHAQVSEKPETKRSLLKVDSSNKQWSPCCAHGYLYVYGFIPLCDNDTALTDVCFVVQNTTVFYGQLPQRSFVEIVMWRSFRSLYIRIVREEIRSERYFIFWSLFSLTAIDITSRRLDADFATLSLKSLDKWRRLSDYATVNALVGTLRRINKGHVAQKIERTLVQG